MNYDELINVLRSCQNTDCELCHFADKQKENYVKFCGAMDAAADAIEELQKPQWISVKDAMPEECEDVLLLFEHNQAVGFWTGIGWSINSGDDFYTSLDFAEPYPTHWMPLPSVEGLNG